VTRTGGPGMLNMRSLGCRGLLIYCTNAPRCWHNSRINADRWPDGTAMADVEQLFVCTQCGVVGAELGPDFSQHTGHNTYAYGNK
jgi:hypothetical protein